VSSREAAVLAKIAVRTTSLAYAAKGIQTELQHKQEYARFEKYMCEEVGRKAVDAIPWHICGYLMSLDTVGKNIVHDITCSAKGGTKAARGGCTCPSRLKANTVKKVVANLSACFNALAMSGDWDPRSRAGNPCHSRAVKQYMANMAKEQLAAGVVTKQAMVFHLDIYDRMLNACISSARADGVSKLHTFEWIQTALQFALLYCTFNRGCNICDITWEQLYVVTDHEGHRALQLLCSMSKTGGTSGKRATVTLRDTGIAAIGVFAPVVLYDAFLALSEDHEIDYGTRDGYIFRKRIAEPMTAMPTRTLAEKLAKVASTLGLQIWGITIHSFRGSGAIAALQAGVPPDIVMYMAGRATPEMMDYYTQVRQMLNYVDNGAHLDPAVVLALPEEVPTARHTASAKHSFTAGPGRVWRP
jgi:integrase